MTQLIVVIIAEISAQHNSPYPTTIPFEPSELVVLQAKSTFANSVEFPRFHDANQPIQHQATVREINRINKLCVLTRVGVLCTCGAVVE